MNDSEKQPAAVNPYAAPAVEKNRAEPDECPSCLAKQRRFAMLGHYYQCPACERDLVLRLPPVTREIFYLASAIGFAAAVWWGGSSWITAAAIFFGISDAAARVYCGEISVKSQVKHPKRDLSTILLTIAVVAGVAFVAFTTTLIGGIWVPLIFIGGSCCVVFFASILLFGKRNDAGYLDLPPRLLEMRHAIGLILVGMLMGIMVATIVSL